MRRTKRLRPKLSRPRGVEAHAQDVVRRFREAEEQIMLAADALEDIAEAVEPDLDVSDPDKRTQRKLRMIQGESERAREMLESILESDEWRRIYDCVQNVRDESNFGAQRKQGR